MTYKMETTKLATLKIGIAEEMRRHRACGSTMMIMIENKVIST